MDPTAKSNAFEITIGLECHAQLKTRTKLFCGCSTEPAPPNTHLCPICIGHIGTLPILNGPGLELAVRAGLAFGCTVHPYSHFERKHYASVDLPKGYQITQSTSPLCTGGVVHVQESVAHTITRIQLEEDSAQLHRKRNETHANWNRAGVPLIEVVGAPDIQSPKRAEEWARMVHRVLVEAEICDGQMQHGQMRFDANISVTRPGGDRERAVRVEIKNINSFVGLRKALETEAGRQSAQIQTGQTVRAETRSWQGKHSVPNRRKETAAEYRLMPEPDIPPVHVSSQLIVDQRQHLPGVPLDLLLLRSDRNQWTRLTTDLHLSKPVASWLMHRRQSIQWLEEAIALGGNPQKMAEWIQTGLVKEPIRETLLYFVELQKLIDQKNLPTNIARNALENAQRDGTQPVEMARKWLSTLNDDETLIRQTVRSVLAEHPTHLCRFLAGEKALLDFFMGRIMAQHVGFGNVDPRVVRRVLMNEMEKK